MKQIILTICCILFVNVLQAQKLPEFQPLSDVMTPLEIAEFVATNAIDQTHFSYEYRIQKPSREIEFIDFGKSFIRRKPGVAYALSAFYSEVEQVASFDVGSTSGIKIWVNDQLVYSRSGDRKLPDNMYDEQTYNLSEQFSVSLREGENKVLVKSLYSGEGDWQLLLQSRNMGGYAAKGKKIKASIKKYVPEMDISNWLILGCFDIPNGNGLDIKFEPEESLQFHKLYKSGGETFVWNIPRVNILTANTDDKYYRWVYHVGGYTWGLQSLSVETNNSKYDDFASSWCDYTLQTMPLAEYQMKELHAAKSMNWRRPMLDYTTAPSLPYISRLLNEESFAGREEYETYIEGVIDYVRNEQYRLPSGLFMRKYMLSPTVWADDMFMGVPFLLLSAEYTKEAEVRESLYDDAANQIIQCNKLLFDQKKQLYRQACYVEHPEQKVPFWSRGNGWAIWGASEALLRLPEDHKDYKQVLKIFRKHIDGIIAAQDQDGYWHNILDMPETVRESSGTAIFTLCIARGINNGWLDKDKYGPIAEKGWLALNSFIGQDGNLYGVKAGTNFSTDPKDYEDVPFYKSDTHGVFPLIFACIEMDHYYKSK